MPAKKKVPGPQNKMKIIYDAYSYARSDANALRYQLGIINKTAPGLAKKTGLSHSDVIAIRRIEAKLSKVYDGLIEMQEKVS